MTTHPMTDTERARDFKQMVYLSVSYFTGNFSECLDEIERKFIEALTQVREKEREACAKEADFYHDEHVCDGDSGYRVSGFISTAIRGRGKK